MSPDELVKLSPILAVGATILVALVGIIASLCTTWLTGRRQRRDKLDERRSLRDDGFRSELRHAYAQFLASQWKRLALISELLLVAEVVNEKYLEIQNRQPALRFPAKILEEENGRLVAKFRALRDGAADAGTESTVRLAELLLLESERNLVANLIAIREGSLEWSGDDAFLDVTPLKTKIAAHEKKLQALVETLIGRFAPAQWDEKANPVPGKSLKPRTKNGGE